VAQTVQDSIGDFVLDLLLAAILSFVLGAMYVKYGRAISNRKAFAGNFVLITMTTMLIISVVKSSLALTLGLVAALSIVRFRAAIKEPEELAYLFLAVAIGLGLGADQRLITLAAFAIIIGIIWLLRFYQRSQVKQNLPLIVSSHNPEKVELQDIVQVLNTHSAAASLKRFNDTREMVEAAFLVEFEGFSQLEASKRDLQALGDAVRITFLENKGVGGV
jgi:uncharacterized membrane protein YhiD involved in acid resistance